MIATLRRLLAPATASTRSRAARRFVVACRVVGATMLAAIVALFVSAAATPLPKVLAPDGGHGGSTVFVDRNGVVLRELRGRPCCDEGGAAVPCGPSLANEDAARATWVPLDEAGKNVALAVIAAEDRRFYEHVGIDPGALVRAIGTSLRARRVVSGASTLTMQLARVVVPHRRNLRGKLGEMAMAVRIEASLDKDAILEQYLNRAPFADGVRGIGAASRYFFDKPPAALSVAEAATLAALPRGPHYYSLTKRPERVLARRDRVLDRMLAAKMIDADVHARAKAEPLTLNLQRGGFGAPHLVDAIVAGSLPGTTRLACGGGDHAAPRIETTIDGRLQAEIERAVVETLRPLEKRNVTAASVLVVDNASGDVLAYVGSPRWDDDRHGGKNDGVRALRQPGSTLKPFVYGLAIEDLGYSSATLLPDVELHVPTPGGIYTPRNYDERFHGPVRLREALANSYNVPAVHVATEVGLPRLLDRLHELGFASLKETAEYYGPGLALGDGEVRLWDLAGAYLAIANGGLARPLRVLRAASAEQSRRIMSAASAAILGDVLADPSARVAAFGEHSALDMPFAVAAKTGTSKGYRDNWTVGFTRDVTVAVWVGNFDGSPMTRVSGITGAAPLFRLAIEAATRSHGHDGAPTLPSSVERVSVCALSGGAAGPGCQHTVAEVVTKGSHGAHEEPCKMHEVVAIDVRNGLRATTACPSRFVVTRTFEVHDGAFATWARAAGREIPPEETSPLCGGVARADRAAHGGREARVGAIRYPHDGARFFVDPHRPAAAQSIPVRIDAPAASRVAIFVDGRLAGEGSAGTSHTLPLVRGDHVVVAEVDGQRADTIAFRVE